MRRTIDDSALRADSAGAETLSRTERKKREKVAAIKRAARDLFATKGFKLTRTREIAERADIGAGTLFLYTSSKEELLVEIFLEELGRTLDEAFATLPEGQPLLEQLLHIFNPVVRYHEPDPELARVFVKELTFVEERLKERTAAFLRDWYSRMAAVIERAQARDEFPRDVPACALARNCFALYISTLRTWLGAEHSREECESWLRASIGLHLRCALPARPASAGDDGSAASRNGTAVSATPEAFRKRPPGESVNERVAAGKTPRL